MSESRIHSMDLARGLAVLFMVMVHVLDVYGTSTVGSSWFGTVVGFLGGPPAAPVFVFLMGASLAFSRRATLKRGLRRGVELLLLAYILNFLRGVLPVFVGLRLGAITLDDIAPLTPTSVLWAVDILQFAGLGLILLALIRRLLPRPVGWLMLAGAVAVGSPLLWGRMSGWPPLDWLLTLLWGTGGVQVAFPVFPWLSYPLSGMAFGCWLAASTNHDNLFRRVTGSGLVLLFLGTAVTLTDPKFHIGDYWRTGPGGVTGITGFVLLWSAVCHWLVKRVPANSLFSLFYYWSAHVTVFYCVQWIIIGWGAMLAGFQGQGLLATILLIFVVVALSDQVTRMWAHLVRRSGPPIGYTVSKRP